MSARFLIAADFRRAFAFFGDFLVLAGAFFGDVLVGDFFADTFFFAVVLLADVFFGDFADTFFFAGDFLVLLADVFFLGGAFFADLFAAGFLPDAPRAEPRFFALVSALALFFKSSSLRCGNFARSPLSNSEGMVGFSSCCQKKIFRSYHPCNILIWS